MKFRWFDFTIVTLIGIVALIVTILSYFAITWKPVGSPMIPQPSLTVKVSLQTDKIRYTLGQDINVRIVNNSDKDIWLANGCGIPFDLLEYKKFEWELHDPYPTKDCYASPVFIGANDNKDYSVNLQNVFGYHPYAVVGGRYKLVAHYTEIEPKLGAKLIYTELFSNEFELVGFSF